MTEIGIVKEVDHEKNIITIEFEGKGACKNCGICLIGPDKAQTLMQVQAANTLQAKQGDKVEFEVKEGETLKASLMLYGFPLSMFLLGFVLGQQIANWLKISPDIPGLILALVFFVGAFNYLGKLEKKKVNTAEHIQLLKIL